MSKPKPKEPEDQPETTANSAVEPITESEPLKAAESTAVDEAATAAEEATEPQTPEAEPEASEPAAELPAATAAQTDGAGSALEAPATRWFKILYDTVGSGPSFHKGAVVAAADLEFLGIERLLAVGAIEEL